MPSAFVLINVEAGAEDSVLKQVRKTGTVEESYVSYGVYDLVVRVKANSMEELKDIVSHKLRAINEVRSSLTLILVEE